MPAASPSPGPDAQGAFKTGMITAALAALTFIAALYWVGLTDVVGVAYALLILFPVYLVFAASALSVWLGYNKDATDLRPVYREKKTK